MTASVDALFARLRAGDRRALAQAITIVESTRDDDRAAAEALLDKCLPLTGRALRVGISGTPGVGKSTFVEALGMHIVGDVDGGIGGVAGSGGALDGAGVGGGGGAGGGGGGSGSIAVLAVDPSSSVTGGSILGDKTRMENLTKHARAYVRPQPSRGALGGTAPHTGDAIALCEAAGFDVVVVETVGVGQSEAAVRDLVDTFVLLMAPAGGDELQGVKRGVLELVDVIVVNKADGDLLAEAMKTRDDYDVGSRLFSRALADWRVPVMLASARENRGVDDVWRTVREHRAVLEKSGVLHERRAAQAESALWRAVDEELGRRTRRDPRAGDIVARVRSGKTSPARGARELL